MDDLFSIGNARFEFAPDTEVVFDDGGMRFSLRARPVPYDARLHLPVFDPEAAAEPGVAPGFSTPTVFHFYDRTDTPRRLIDYPEQQPAEHDFHFFESGLSFGLRFHGRIDVGIDRIEIAGTLRKSYEQAHEGTPVHVVRHFAPGEVRLKPHTYASLEEAEAVDDPARVRRLLWRQPWDSGAGERLDAFPAGLLRFANLEFLSLQFASADCARFEDLPDALCDLTQLRALYIANTRLRRLPARLGALQNLCELSITRAALTELPASIGALAKLERLILSGNALKTLPACVGDLPALRLLHIGDNAFESLPASLRHIREVKVEKRAEALFRDIRYRPEVQVGTDTGQFLASGSPWHVERLREALARHRLKRYEKALLRHARQALRCRTTVPDDHAVKGRTRFGGAPDLPDDIDYPMTDGKHWHFLAQIDLEAIAGLQRWLPRVGRLYFFAEGQERGDGVRVLHSTASVSGLRTYAWPADAEFADGDNMPGPYAAYRAEVDATVSLPVLYNAASRLDGKDKDASLLRIAEGDALWQAYRALEAELTGGGAHLIGAHVFTQGDSPEEQAARDRGGLPGEWVNLLMLASDDRTGFNFWDRGTQTFTIHQKDLALGDFSRVHDSLESS